MEKSQVDAFSSVSKIISPKSSSNVRSRYLTESVGSCHDLCKYGRKHESGRYEKRLSFRRFMANRIDLAPITIDQKNNSVNKMKPSDVAEVVEQTLQISDKFVYLTPLSKGESIAGYPQVIPQEKLDWVTESLANAIGLYESSINIDSEANSSAYKSMDPSEKEMSSRNLEQEKIHPKVEAAVNAELLNGRIKNKQANKVKISSVEKLNPAKTYKLNQKKLTASGEEKNSGIMKQSIPSSKLEVIAKNAITRKQSASPKLQKSGQNSSSPSKNTNGSVIPAATSLNLKTPLIRSTFQLKKSKKDNFHENIAKVFEPKLDGNSVETLENSRKELGGYVSESVIIEPIIQSSNERIQINHRRCVSEKEDKRQRKASYAVRQQAGGSPSPYKLKFKKGRVVDNRSSDISTPKRLRFRRGRILDGDLNDVEVLKRSFRRKRAINGSNECSSEPHAVILKKANLKPKGATLKHQDAPGKKDVPPLFNHVIEETASKLVETRKSKVKALVGAFETVISLQEAKPVLVL